MIRCAVLAKRKFMRIAFIAMLGLAIWWFTSGRHHGAGSSPDDAAPASTPETGIDVISRFQLDPITLLSRPESLAASIEHAEEALEDLPVPVPLFMPFAQKILPFVRPEYMVSPSTILPPRDPDPIAGPTGFIRPETLLAENPSIPKARIDNARTAAERKGALYSRSILDFYAQSATFESPFENTDALAKAVYFVREAERLMLARQLEEALAFHQQALELFPKMTYARWQAGRIAIMQGNYRGAIRYLREAINTTTDLAETLNDLGIAYLYAGLPGEALTAFETATASDPDSREPLFNTALALRRLNRNDEARHQFETYSKVVPEDARPVRELAVLDMIEGQYQIARMRIDQAIKLAANWPQPLLDAALLCADMEAFDAAMDYLARALEIAPARLVYDAYRQPVFNKIRLSPLGTGFEAQLAERARRQIQSPANSSPGADASSRPTW